MKREWVFFWGGDWGLGIGDWGLGVGVGVGVGVGRAFLG